MRLFLAIELPGDVRSHLLEARRRLEVGLPKIAYTKGENLHVTLKFLGDVESKRVGAIKESLAMIKPPRIELRAIGIDCFPNRGPIRIVAAALDGTLPPLRALVESIEQRCKFLGFEREQRAYKPHVTIGRARPVLSAKFRQLAGDATLGLWPGPSFAPREFVLMDSLLSPEGSKYSPVEHFPIGDENSA
jgi:RNA 2',3'-cyclic 3'-phosphodiesterase